MVGSSEGLCAGKNESINLQREVKKQEGQECEVPEEKPL
jgi:hypothetical protein